MFDKHAEMKLWNGQCPDSLTSGLSSAHSSVETGDTTIQFRTFLFGTPCAALPEELGKHRCVMLAEHNVGVAAVRSEVFLGVLRRRSPAQRFIAGARPFFARQEQADTAREVTGCVATRRRNRGALNLGAQDQH